MSLISSGFPSLLSMIVNDMQNVAVKVTIHTINHTNLCMEAK